MEFIGRRQELDTLEAEYRRDGGFVVIYGRRRVGKTTLIKEFIRGKTAFYFLATEEKPPCGCGGYSQTPANPCKHSLFSNFIPHDLPRFLANHGHFSGPQLASD